MSNFIINKVEGDTLQPLEWNQFAELNNLITSSEQNLDANVLEQIAKAVVNYVNSGNFYTENGVANSYTLIGTGSFKTPTAYRNGMVIRFITTNANTTTTPIINLAGLGAKNILKADGTAVIAGDISGYVELRYNGTDFLLNKKNPSIQKFTSGSGTYTTPANALYLRVRQVGGGGGGGGSGGNGGVGATGGNTTFGTSLLVANGGTGGATNGAIGGSGGSASLGTGPIGTALSGGYGQAGFTSSAIGTNPCGGFGGSTAFGGAGSGANGSTGGGGGSAINNTGAGGGGAGGTSTTTFAGAGGGAGGCINAIIESPSTTYAYTVGSGGAGGTAGTSGSTGGSGGTGYIEITEFYN